MTSGVIVPVDADMVERVIAAPPVAATALVATIGNARQCKNGRELSASLGLVPRQHSLASAPCCSASASGATVMCVRCSSTEHEPLAGWPSANATRVTSG